MTVGRGTATNSDALTLTSSYQTIQASSADLEISLAANQFVELQIEVDFQTSPTDDGQWKVQSSPNATNWHDEAGPFRIDNGTDPAYDGVIVYGPSEVRIQANQSGSTDTTNSATVTYRVATMS